MQCILYRYLFAVLDHPISQPGSIQPRSVLIQSPWISLRGKPDMVIANRERLPAPISNGKEITSGRGTDSGMLLYNALSD